MKFVILYALLLTSVIAEGQSDSSTQNIFIITTDSHIGSYQVCQVESMTGKSNVFIQSFQQKIIFSALTAKAP